MTSAYEQGQIPNFQLRHRLQLARENAGYSRRELADAMEVSRNSILNAESGRTVPRKLVLNAWALACGVPVTWLVTGQPPGGNDPDGNLRTLDYKNRLSSKVPGRVVRLQTNHPVVRRAG